MQLVNIISLALFVTGTVKAAPQQPTSELLDANPATALQSEPTQQPLNTLTVEVKQPLPKSVVSHLAGRREPEEELQPVTDLSTQEQPSPSTLQPKVKTLSTEPNLVGRAEPEEAADEEVEAQIATITIAIKPVIPITTALCLTNCKREAAETATATDAVETAVLAGRADAAAPQPPESCGFGRPGRDTTDSGLSSDAKNSLALTKSAPLGYTRWLLLDGSYVQYSTV
ncbi:uncharacterized protein K452DRAFT_299112 [Aplosporella prunicola CBS 121167]|uniref:Uncharacterized protein n=1 Tax=Aplosporella prunicola CBS 121167 TaxID=1176127 RepID=A0A6A6BCH2_9PEZI|nr:uncharacterized protein K452DRAFT_299112 [Aplosporella prunicola CBS 121167]KAF2141053.1 hypothetical protein K452DRAFT_299112 [Aplosporella prunicola CBS 121167]